MVLEQAPRTTLTPGPKIGVHFKLHLTPIEYKLLMTLVRNGDAVMTHRQLLEATWGPGAANQTQYLRVYMGHLRKKLEQNPARPRYLLTEAGVGYRLRS